MSAGRVPTSPSQAAAGAPTTSKYLLQVADASLPNAQALGALATGILKNATATGVQSIAAPGVDYSKGPWKLFSTVRNSGAAQTLSIPVTDGENNGVIRAYGRLLSDGTGRNVTVKINGSSTNVSLQGLQGTGAATAASTAWLGGTSVYGAFFSLVMFTAKTANALKRFGVIQIVEANATIAAASYASGFHFKDTTTIITSIDLDCGNATGFAANTEAMVMEGIVS